MIDRPFFDLKSWDEFRRKLDGGNGKESHDGGDVGFNWVIC